MQRVHKWTQEKVDALKSSLSKKAVKRKSTGDGGENSTTDPPPPANFWGKRRITQKDVDDAVLDLVINERLPYRTVDSPYFRKAVLLGCPENLTVRCRQTFAKKLSGHHDEMVENVTKEIASAQYVCTTADAWTKFRRGYLGMTCTWLNKKTMEREIVALAVTRLRGRHTHQRLAAAMKNVNSKFKLSQEKIRKTITDSGANFVKAFKVYASAKADNRDGDSGK